MINILWWIIGFANDLIDELVWKDLWMFMEVHVTNVSQIMIYAPRTIILYDCEPVTLG